MITIKCDTIETKLRLCDLKPFQGNLKKRTAKDISELSGSLINDGMQMPFVVWKSDTGNMLLDGHGRLAALTELAVSDPEIVEQEFPVIYVTADSEDEARKALLQITSSYGKITKDGAIRFCATIPTYSAPAVNKFIHTKTAKRKMEQLSTVTVLRVQVPTDKADEVKVLLSQVDYIKVL